MSADWDRLSSATSRTEHTCRATGEKGCRGCRWFETRLSRRPHGGDTDRPDCDDWEYRLEIVGKSIVPGEVDRIRVEHTTSAHAVIDFLALGEPNNRYIPKVSRMVLHEAAEIDDGIGDAIDDFDAIAAG